MSRTGFKKTFRLWPHRLLGEGLLRSPAQSEGSGEGAKLPLEPAAKLPKSWRISAGKPARPYRREAHLIWPDGLSRAEQASEVSRDCASCARGSGARRGAQEPAGTPHAWALWQKPPPECRVVRGVEREIRRYLAGDVLPCETKGWTLVQVDGLSLGWAKGDGRVLKKSLSQGASARDIKGGRLHGREKRILIVEDERAIVEILKFNLMREGYDTLEALDGELGLELARTKDPDLILLDVMLPKMNGFEICQNLRDAREAPSPIIMLTARGRGTDKVFGLEAGADDYMTKPFFHARAHGARAGEHPEEEASIWTQEPRSGRFLKAGELVIGRRRSPSQKRRTGRPLRRRNMICFCTCCAKRGRCSRARTSCRRSGTTIILATCGLST